MYVIYKSSSLKYMYHNDRFEFQQINETSLFPLQHAESPGHLDAYIQSFAFIKLTLHSKQQKMIFLIQSRPFQLLC